MELSTHARRIELIDAVIHIVIYKLGASAHESTDPHVWMFTGRCAMPSAVATTIEETNK